MDQQDHAGAERDGCKDGESGVLFCDRPEGKEKAQVNKKSPERFVKNVRAFLLCVWRRTALVYHLRMGVAVMRDYYTT